MARRNYISFGHLDEVGQRDQYIGVRVKNTKCQKVKPKNSGKNVY